MSGDSHSATFPSQGEADDRRIRFLRALEGIDPMTWDMWAVRIDDATSLTEAGRHAARWAVAVLAAALGDDCPERARAAPGHPLAIPWPLVDGRWVYEDLLHVAALLALGRGGRGWRKVTKTLSRNLQSEAWEHGLLQFELFGLAARDA